MTNTVHYGTGRWDQANAAQREALARELERTAALLRRESFSVHAAMHVVGPVAAADIVRFEMTWQYGARMHGPVTFEQYRGLALASSYRSSTVQGRSALAFEHVRRPGVWRVSVHDSEGLTERWVGGRLLCSAPTASRPVAGPALEFPRSEAERIADDWCHLAELPACDLLPSGGVFSPALRVG